MSTDVATPSSDGNDGAKNQASILSSKVSRALEVRSDTPAMKAALDALAHLPDHQDDLFSVDSRSVRVAIEQDALQQALLLQEKLRSLLNTVSDLRNGVSETAAIANRVEDAIHTNIMADSKAPPSEKQATENIGGTENEENANSAQPQSRSAMKTTSDSALESEERLASLLSDAFTQRNMARRRVEAVHTFLEKFDLSEEDSRLLDHYAFEDVEASGVNGLAFLAALDRVGEIRAELGQTFGTMDLLHMQQKQQSSSSSNDSKALGASSALRMMESLAQKQERAYERLYHWLQKYLHVYGNESSRSNSFAQQDDDMLDESLSHPFVRRALYTLRNVPAFYSHLLELIAGSRRSEVTRRFLLALTSGYGGLPPIEMRAHDAVVYTGDMLAFCFRAFSVEADVVKGILNYDPSSDDSDGPDSSAEKKKILPLTSEDGEIEYSIEKPITAAEMLAQSMGGVSRPLKSRILQVVASLSRRQSDEYESDDDMNDDIEEEGSSTRARLAQLYEICGLLLFYASALEKGVSKLQSAEDTKNGDSPDVPEEKNPLQAAMIDCLGEATQAFDASLRVYCAMFEQLNLLTGDSESYLAHAMIVQLAELRKASPGFMSNVKFPTGYEQTLSLDWSCQVLVEAALPSCRSLDDTVVLKQGISAARQADLGLTVAHTLDEKIHEQETALIDVLVEKETVDVLDLCGLGSLVSAWERFKGVQVEGMVMAAHPGLSHEEAQAAMKEFYSSLYSPPLPSFEGTIKDPSLRKVARKKIADNVCSTYSALYESMSKSDKGGYEDLSFLGHTPEQVNTLFTV
eukprot:scaffold6265_cov193-Cylindrotheca_fusiformis.AAC.8